MSKIAPTPSKAASGVPEILMLEYNKTAGPRFRPSNITAVQAAWHAQFSSKYGAAGMFILNGAYRIVPTPPRPDGLLPESGIDRESVEYDILKGEYMQELTIASKQRAEDKELRTKIYSDMWTQTTENARAEIMMHPSYTGLAAAGNDPLALWKVMVLTLTTVTGASPDVIAASLLEAYKAYRQMSNCSLAT